ncbi:DUF4277 domain-containing protein [Candidatus Poribacteria bacterium]|nr:DUF4277 domain-containing protein [Candidatus Poribacteria bacterium]
MAELTIHTERIDDIPLLLQQQEKMGIAEVIDAVIEPHGNRQGLSVGELTTSWISYILSEVDHRMVEVEPWAEQHIETLSAGLGKPVSVKDFTDDLHFFSDDDVWEEVETQLSQQLIRVYNLNLEPIRLDSTTASVYHEISFSVTDTVRTIARICHN